MVFIRPTILRDRADANFQTNSKYNDVRELQRRLAQDPVRLMRDESHPELPPLPSEEIPPIIPGRRPYPHPAMAATPNSAAAPGAGRRAKRPREGRCRSRSRNGTAC